jgi:hypothetical protein
MEVLSLSFHKRLHDAAFATPEYRLAPATRRALIDQRTTFDEDREERSQGVRHLILPLLATLQAPHEQLDNFAQSRSDQCVYPHRRELHQRIILLKNNIWSIYS